MLRLLRLLKMDKYVPSVTLIDDVAPPLPTVAPTHVPTVHSLC